MSTRRLLALKRILLGILGVLLASQVAVVAYGYFAARARGSFASALEVQEDVTTLDRVVAPLIRGHARETGLVLHTSNLDAFVVRALTARAAGRSLDLQYYLWHADLTGRLLMAEVLAAADRGVRVRVLLDDINAHDSDEPLRVLDDHPNIEVRMYNPSRNRKSVGRGLELLLRGLSLNRRMHNKAWTADGRIAIVGGRNVGDEYFDASGHANFLDADITMVGPAVAATSAMSDEFWNSEAVLPIGVLVDGSTDTLAPLRRQLRTLADSDEARSYVDHLISSYGVERVLRGRLPLIWSEEVSVRSDPPTKAMDDRRAGWMIEHIAHALDQARVRIEIISPYFVPGQAGLQWIEQARARGVEVAVLTNSLAATDVAAVYGAYAPYRTPLLRAGVELYEVMASGSTRGSMGGSSGTSLHTKAFTVDDDLGFVGSFNFDPRSVNLNTEMGVFFRSPALVAQLKQAFRRKTGDDMSYRVVLDADELAWEDRRNTPPVRVRSEPGADVWKRIFAVVVSWLPIESQL